MNKTQRHKSTSDVRPSEHQQCNYAIPECDYNQNDFDNSSDFYNFNGLEDINNLLESSHDNEDSLGEENLEKAKIKDLYDNITKAIPYKNKEKRSNLKKDTKKQKKKKVNFIKHHETISKEYYIKPTTAKSSQQINSNYFLAEIEKNKSAMETAKSLFELNSFKSHSFVQLINNQQCSRILQDRLTDFIDELDFLIEEINVDFTKIVVNQYGNYFCQRLVENCDFKQRCKILSYLADSFQMICYDQFGSHVIQKMIELCHTAKEANVLLRTVQGLEVKIATNKRAYHILVKIIHFVPENLRIGFNMTLLMNLKDLCMNLHGVCVVKKLVSSAEHYGLVNGLKSELAKHAVDLTQNSNGIFIFLHILDVWHYQGARGCFLPILENAVDLCTKKYSESIISKIMPMLSIEEKKSMQAKILKADALLNLLENKQGSNTVRNLLFIMDAEERETFRKYLQKLYSVVDDEPKTLLEGLLLDLYG